MILLLSVDFKTFLPCTFGDFDHIVLLFIYILYDIITDNSYPRIEGSIWFSMTTLVPVCGLWVEHNQCKSCETWQCTVAACCPCRCYDQVSPSQSTTECLRGNTDAHILYLTCLSYCVCAYLCVVLSLLPSLWQLALSRTLSDIPAVHCTVASAASIVVTCWSSVRQESQSVRRVERLEYYWRRRSTFPRVSKRITTHALWNILINIAAI